MSVFVVKSIVIQIKVHSKDIDLATGVSLSLAIVNHSQSIIIILFKQL
jgi:hypothetical protein